MHRRTHARSHAQLACSTPHRLTVPRTEVALGNAFCYVHHHRRLQTSSVPSDKITSLETLQCLCALIEASHLIRLDAGCRCQCCHLITWGGGRDEVPDTPPFDLDLAQTKIVREDKITLVRPSLPRQRNNLFIRSFLICYRSPHFF